MDKIWEIAPRKYNDLIDQLLFNRGVFSDNSKKEATKQVFFQPDFEKDLYPASKMKGIKEATLRIKQAAEKGETVGIFADYDADGIPGAALLYRALRQIGIDVAVYIPNRETGYGLAKEGIEVLVSKHCTLIITVDLGIRSVNEAIYCKEQGLDLIITDHHLPGDEIPGALVVINPKQPGDRYPFKELCGCGVAYKLIVGLSEFFPDRLDTKYLKWSLDLVAISTIADVVPLLDENRILAKYGLTVINKTRNVGLANLLKVIGLDEQKKVDAYQVGFQIAPRINAPGRVDHATKSFELLVSSDDGESSDLANWLNEKNVVRQDQMDKAQEEAVAKIAANKLNENKIIIVTGDWQRGIIGPTASRLVEKYARPVIMFAREEDTMTGSARSVPGVNIVEIFELCKSEISKFGGHKGAAGITVAKDNFQKFEKKIAEVASAEISAEALIKKIKIDAKVELTDLTMTFNADLSKFEPFGMGNSRPTFLLSGVRFSTFRFVGKTANHFSGVIEGPRHKFKAIWFSCPRSPEYFDKIKKYDIVFTLSLDEWQNQKTLSFNIQDLRITKE
ncbi:MAG: single-stranded-DNA-specific exonuclease RecJ [Candidatus Berkelbacteria bacterium]